MLKYALSVAALAVVLTGVRADEKDTKATCPVTGKPADMKISVDHMGGKVYFATEEAKATFGKEKVKYSAAANWQLVQTKQFEQIKCPLTGRDCNPEKGTEVKGVKVCVCCGMCEGKVKAAKDDALVQLIFADAAFKKGFAKKGK